VITYKLLDVAIAETNVIKKQAENILKYKQLTIEIERTWDLNTKVIPVNMGKPETTSKSFRKYLSNTLGTARYQATTKNNTRTSENTDVKVQNISHWKQHHVQHKL
jgi:hypothetical protein